MTQLKDNSRRVAVRSVRAINTARREHDFVEACKTLLLRREVADGIHSATQIVDMVLAGRAPAYYVSVAHASARVQAMMNHPLDPGSSYLSPARLLWLEIFKRTSDLLNSRRWLTLDRAVALVLERGNASSFFISRKAALRIFRKHFRRKDFFEESRG